MERFTLFFNIYNILIFHANIAVERPKTGADIFTACSSRVSRVKYSIGGNKYSPIDILHGILRGPYKHKHTQLFFFFFLFLMQFPLLFLCFVLFCFVQICRKQKSSGKELVCVFPFRWTVFSQCSFERPTLSFYFGEKLFATPVLRSILRTKFHLRGFQCKNTHTQKKKARKNNNPKIFLFFFFSYSLSIIF